MAECYYLAMFKSTSGDLTGFSYDVNLIFFRREDKIT